MFKRKEFYNKQIVFSHENKVYSYCTINPKAKEDGQLSDKADFDFGE
jgi:hypothetical protein